MLCSLRIKNLALMDTAVLEFGEGFTVVTGETGAGKSVLIGALSLLAGNRATRAIIRKGAETCEVEGVFQFANPAPLDIALTALELPRTEDGQLILRRTLSLAKPARVHVNGAAATLAQLEALGAAWVDFHGPGEPQKLFHEHHQLEMLDLFAGQAHSGHLAAVGALHGRWTSTLRRIREIRSQGKMSEDEIAFIQGQLERMSALDLSDEGVATLERDFKKAAAAEKLAGLHAAMSAALGDEGGVAAMLPATLRTAREIATLDPGAGELENRLNALAIEIADIQDDYARLAKNIAATDAASQEETAARMNQWLELRRKYGPAPENVRAKRDSLVARLAAQGDIAGVLEQAQAEAETLEAQLRAASRDLHATRVTAAAKLSAAATKMLAKLGFKKAVLNIRVTETAQLTETGATRCEFLFLPNAGQDLLPLSQIASSGETARVMLAIKTVLVSVDKTPVLVFDEVDANVGGEIGAQVGRELAALAGKHQVFCVTHLPQVAAQGQNHHVVEKTQTDDLTTITIHPVHATPIAREQELARMLGDRHSATALQHARELLSAAAR
ncbi:MAG: AAA family ATPase [Puniceicoccales bacterium]|jgi:DNA repair protein RecN (Recombination protein N)|nr:AAA family ATPase [Puniceicoccales bacterium]